MQAGEAHAPLPFAAVAGLLEEVRRTTPIPQHVVALEGLVAEAIARDRVPRGARRAQRAGVARARVAGGEEEDDEWKQSTRHDVYSALSERMGSTAEALRAGM